MKRQGGSLVVFQGVTPNQIPARIFNKGFYCTSSLPVLYPERGRGHGQTENQSARTSRPEEKTKSLKWSTLFPPSPVINWKWSEEKDGGVCFVCLRSREEGYTLDLNQIIIDATWLYQSLKSLQWEELALTWAKKKMVRDQSQQSSPHPPLGFSTSPPRCSSSSSSLTNQTWL